MMELTDTVKELLLNTAKVLKGDARRMFMARTVQALGKGGQQRARQEAFDNRAGMHSFGTSDLRLYQLDTIIRAATQPRATG